MLRQVKLIAEPWDVGEGGYQVGRFPPLWSEWNGQYRDTIRDFWRGEPGTLGDFASRFTGSSDLYERNGRRPSASINFVTAHDGFTLADLVSYNERHNEANGENNRDGESDNRSWNSGVEGPTNDPEIVERRRRRQRAIMTTILLSQGVPMLLAGDEFGRTQNGNNNAYCQDNDLSWLQWDDHDYKLFEFTKRVINLRAKHPVFRRRHFFDGEAALEGDLADIGWFTPEGAAMTHASWESPLQRSIAVFLNGDSLQAQGERGERITDTCFVVLFNANDVDRRFSIPPELSERLWHLELDSSEDKTSDTPVMGSLSVPSWSVVVLREGADS